MNGYHFVFVKKKYGERDAAQKKMERERKSIFIEF